MTTFFIMDSGSIPLAVTTDKDIAEQVMFSISMEKGLVDEEEGTFDLGGMFFSPVELEEVIGAELLTGADIVQLKREGVLFL